MGCDMGVLLCVYVCVCGCYMGIHHVGAMGSYCVCVCVCVCGYVIWVFIMGSCCVCVSVCVFVDMLYGYLSCGSYG